MTSPFGHQIRMFADETEQVFMLLRAAFTGPTHPVPVFDRSIFVPNDWAVAGRQLNITNTAVMRSIGWSRD
jgi:hypothetical protein